MTQHMTENMLADNRMHDSIVSNFHSPMEIPISLFSSNFRRRQIHNSTTLASQKYSPDDAIYLVQVCVVG